MIFAIMRNGLSAWCFYANYCVFLFGLKSTRNGISRIFNFHIVTSFQYKQDIQVGQKVGRGLIGLLKSGMTANMEDYCNTVSNKVLAANVSFLSITQDHFPPSSPCKQEAVGKDDGKEENVGLWVMLWAKMWFTFDIKIQRNGFFFFVFSYFNLSS